MTKISRNWSRLNPDERLALAESVVGKLECSKSEIASNPAFSALKEWATATKNHFAAVKAKERELAQLRQRRETAEDALITSLEAVADLVEKDAGADPQRIVTSGFEPAGGKAPQKIPLTQVINFSVTAGDFEGELDTHWDAVRGAIFYHLQICAGEPDDEKKWKEFNLSKPMRSLDSAHDPSEEFNRTGVKRTKATLTELRSGRRMWVRVRAANVDDVGPWSDPRSKIVP